MKKNVYISTTLLSNLYSSPTLARRLQGELYRIINMIGGFVGNGRRIP